MLIKSERLGVRVTPEMKKSLDEICISENRSISNLVNMIIEKYLDENKIKGKTQ